MAFRIVLQNLCKQYSNLFISQHARTSVSTVSNELIRNQRSLLPVTTCLRSSHTFLSRVTADQLWKGVTSVSNAGRRKGRGRGTGRKIARDLNRGQVIGFGKRNMLWPGLNSPVIQGKEVLQQRELPPDPSREKRILELRDKMSKRHQNKVHPLERGWTGNSLPGRSLGPPDPVGEETFEGFDSRVLMFRPVCRVTADRGKMRRLNSLVVVGNKNGLAGYGLATSANGNTSVTVAKNRAAKCLRYIQRDKGTVLHDFCGEFGAVKVFVKKMPEGHGLVGHRVIQAICKVLGITDLYCKTEGPCRNTIALTRAFFIGLSTQKTPQQLANEKGLYLVELRSDREGFPVVVASPDRCRTEEEIGVNEQLDFQLHVHNGKVVEPRKPNLPFYINFPCYQKRLRDMAYTRNKSEVIIRNMAKYGAPKSFLNIRDEERAKKEMENNAEA